MAQISTQQFLELREIRDDVLILKDGSVRGIMMVSSQNFALKSQEEQEATIYQFQNLLNSLDFSLQIVTQSRKLNITGYIDWLKGLEQEQSNSLLKQQTLDYRKFIEQMIGKGSIMAKNFYIAVPFYLMETKYTGSKSKGLFSNILGGASSHLSDEEFLRLKNQLWQRMEFLAIGLRRMDLSIIPLNSKELIELLWSWHHPKEAEVGYYPQLPPEVLQ